MSQTTPSRPTTRALLGTMALVLFVAVYVLAASSLALLILPRAGRVLEFVYYAVAGLAWVPAAGLILNWMYRPKGDGGGR